MPDEPLSIQFANTRYAVRGDLREGLGTAADLADWLNRSASTQPGEAVIGEGTVTEFRTLRDAIRGLFTAAVNGEPPDPGRLDALNRASRLAPRWPELSTSDGEFAVTERTADASTAAGRAALARDAMDVLAGPLRARLRACGAPGCVLFFVKDHPRREWCSGACGNRARVARHYARRRGG
jgi:predicted RNA-binding Zn ribbon-like protein